MKTRSKKILAAILLAVMLAASLSACGDDEKKDGETTLEPSGTSKFWDDGYFTTPIVPVPDK